MENASKALLMAAGILIGIMIISVAVYLFAASERLGNSIHEKMEENEIKKFNDQFLKYDGLKTCTTHDIVSIANLARNNNLRYDLKKEDASEYTYYVTVNVITKDNIFNNFEAETSEDINLLNQSIKDGTDSLGEKSTIRQFECSVVKPSEITKRVYIVNFNEQ